MPKQIKPKRKQKQKKKKKEKKLTIKVTIVSYLAGYDTKVRKEKQLELKDVTKEEAKKRIKEEQKSLQDELKKEYGQFWKRKTKSEIKTGKSLKIKSFQQRIILKGKDYGIRTIKSKERLFPIKFTNKEDTKLRLLRQQGFSYSKIASKQKRTYESVRSRIRRLEGRKK